jgi:hypothetical protein
LEACGFDARKTIIVIRSHRSLSISLVDKKGNPKKSLPTGRQAPQRKLSTAALVVLAEFQNSPYGLRHAEILALRATVLA